MSFSFEYMRAKTKEYAEEAVRDGLIVEPDTDIEFDGVHPDNGRDLETPSSFTNEMMQVWTLDLGLSDNEKSEIEKMIKTVLNETLPENLRDFL